MKKEVNAMLMMVACAIIGVIFAAIVGLLYTEGYISAMFDTSFTIANMQFLVFIAWLIVGAVLGALRD